MGFKTAKNMKIGHIDVNCDSLLIMNHVNDSYEAKDHKIITCLDITKRLTSYFDTFNIQQVPKKNNAQANALAGLGPVFKDLSLSNIPVIYIMKPTIERLVHDMEMLALDQRDNNSDEGMDSWIQTYKDYLQLRVKPSDNNEARTLRMKVSRFTVVDDELFKKSSTGLL
ncbi:uncharacterized protein LOC141701078 [Apium graveolens]|uniref:uncharacterized protein LOC141701078 n=1 Tax=Apium graveolens TaxID=4045 RepID=UPI003D7BCB49